MLDAVEEFQFGSGFDSVQLAAEAMESLPLCLVHVFTGMETLTDAT